jgi:prepilin-type N-terminal cleavage/methylation domain-containing protein
MMKKHGAFTLIELMVVVAIIAILSAMGVANFSTAIKRARNATRQSDILAVSKGLETCYDVMRAMYLKKSDGLTAHNEQITIDKLADARGVFIYGTGEGENQCLNGAVAPSLVAYPYSYNGAFNTQQVQKYMLCAQLEPVGNWETIGNSAEDLADGRSIDQAIRDLGLRSFPCNADQTGSCYFCVAAQQ